jgi:hypothetical protein
VFIAHSLGGLLVKYVLFRSLKAPEPDKRRIAPATRGICFLATPHQRADIAHVITFFGGLWPLLRVSESVRELRGDNPYLIEMNNDFRRLVQHTGIAVKIYYETRPTRRFGALRFLRGVVVVPQGSADPGLASSEALPADEDHISICKPSPMDSPIAEGVRQFVAACIAPTADTQHLPSPNRATPSSGQPRAPDPQNEPQGDRAAHEALAGSASDRSLRETGYPGAALNPNRIGQEIVGGKPSITRPSRIFISYAHDDPDEAVARQLKDGLGKAGHEVFIGTEVPLGVDWGSLIDEEIARSDYFVLLLSARSAHSEMVREEARLAHERRKGAGIPRLLPIRIAYPGPLGYALSTWTRSVIMLHDPHPTR